ncbi:hypothetical protein acdb102_44870 [Acidothermaceae bacterium B102]|nr:hypothetical protein acdb102_44870 [Acidothermaceae bacterium B102]
MSISVVLDVAIGLALVFLVFSVAVSKINEIVTTLLNTRGKQLEDAIVGLLGSGDPAKNLSNHLMNGPWKNLRVAKAAATAIPKVETSVSTTFTTRARKLSLPTYISGDAFAKGVFRLSGIPVDDALRGIDLNGLSDAAKAAYQTVSTTRTKDNAEALLQLVPVGSAQRPSVQQLVDATSADPDAEAAGLLKTLPPDSPLGNKLQALTAAYGNDRTKILNGLTAWYDETMERLSGAYKRRVQKFVIAYALIVTLAFNVDAVAMTSALWRNEPARTLAVAEAQKQLDAGAPAGEASIRAAAAKADSELSSAQSLDLPIGWSTSRSSLDAKRRLWPAASQWPMKILGWAITVLALLFGAPFWFDALGKLVNMRGSGPKPASSTTSATTAT